MADNFGSGQPRVLNVNDRSLDQVVFQQSRPPLTSEWNLINQICDLKSQENIRINQPSGWLKVGAIEDTGATDSGTEIIAEENARSGQVLASTTYDPNTFKLINRELTNVAIVNGWPIVVQNPANLALIPAGENDIATDITMTLPEVSSTYRYDIVFLEVWKKLVSYTDPIYPYGNVQAVPLADNEIMWDVIGAETTKRVQIQYRIRTFPNANPNNPVDPNMYPEGLGWSGVQPIGGRDAGDYVTTSGTYFKSAGHRDIGLYIAGDGSEAHKTLFNTVDGFVYAIPMFLVYRRGLGYTFTASNTHSTVSVLGDSGSDRPDGKYSNAIYADDIIDTRHQLITSGKSLEGILKESFRKLISNELNTSLNQGFTSSNQKIICSGGSSLLKVDQVNGTDSFIPNIGNGCLTPDFKRRAYCNAGLLSDHNVFQVPTPVGGWQEGTTVVPVSSFFSSSLGAIESVDGLYFVDPLTNASGYVTNATYDSLNIIINSSSNIVDTSDLVYIEFTFRYDASNNGFFDVPKKFYEVDKGTYLPIATRDQTVPIRYDSNNNLIAGTVSDVVRYCGGNYTESYEFGHDYLLYTQVNSSTFFITCTNGKYNGYPILGIKNVQIKTGGSYGLPETFSVIRYPTGYQISIVSTVIITPTDLLITLSTGSGSTEIDSFKFFELSKQGRGITDVYEMILVTATAISEGAYLVDTIDKPIIAIGSYESTDMGFIKGIPYAYDDSGNRVDVKIVPPGGGTPVPEVNNYLPVLNKDAVGGDDTYLPTRIVLTTDFGYSYITVPVLVHSYVSKTEEAYSFYYKFNPYQGLLIGSSVEKGKIELEGSAVVTSEGSGAVNNHIFRSGLVSINQGDRTVVQTDITVSWTNYVQPGDYIKVDYTPYFYRVINVDSDSELTLAEPFNESSVTAVSYSIIRLDIPVNNISNTIDMLPTYDRLDYKGMGTSIDFGTLAGSSIELLSKKSDQSPIDTLINDFQLGLTKPANSRGRSYFRLTDGKNSFIKLGVLTSNIKYGTLPAWYPTNGHKKVYQAYLYNKTYLDNSAFYRDLTGKLYLLVVSSETNLDSTDILLNGFSDKDTVDIFELVGRPIIKTI